jgi:hypothetical protein
MQYSQKGFQWFAKFITRISFLNVGYGRSTQSLSGHIASRETPSEAVWQGIGYKSIFEITRNPSTGANPVCPKSVNRAVAKHMG